MSETQDYETARKEAALEVMAAMIGTRARRKREAFSAEIRKRFAVEERRLLRERNEIQSGNKQLIEKALTLYAKEIRQQRGG